MHEIIIFIKDTFGRNNKHCRLYPVDPYNVYRDHSEPVLSLLFQEKYNTLSVSVLKSRTMEIHH